MMTCREFADFLWTLVEGELPEKQQAVFERHIKDCPGCGSYLESYRETIRLGKSVCKDPDGLVPDDVPEELVQAILAARRHGD